jgi:exodeoxyribonuclease VII small subunit
MVRPSRKPGIESQLKSLENIVKKLEDGSLPLEESLILFEEGIRLSRELQSALQNASLKVTQLLEGEPLRESPLPAEDPEGTGP